MGVIDQDQAQGGQAQDTSNNPEDNSGTLDQDQGTPVPDQDQDQAQGGQAQDTGRDQDGQSQGDNSNTQGQEPKDSEDDQGDSQAEDPKDSEDDLTDEEMEALDTKVKRTLSKVRRENSNLRDRLKTEAARADRAEVALAAEGLPRDAIKFITGETREEMEKSAEDLLVLLGYSETVTPPGLPVERGGQTYRGKDGVPDSQAASETDLDKIGSRMFRR